MIVPPYQHFSSSAMMAVSIAKDLLRVQLPGDMINCIGVWQNPSDRNDVIVSGVMRSGRTFRCHCSLLDGDEGKKIPGNAILCIPNKEGADYHLQHQLGLHKGCILSISAAPVEPPEVLPIVSQSVQRPQPLEVAGESS